MAGMMDDLMREQLGNAQSSFARRQRASGLPGNQLPASSGVPEMADPQAMHGQAQPNQTWLLHAPGQPAPAEHFNFQPQAGGAWRIYPPGRRAPTHGPQGSYPVMPPSYDHIKSLGEDLDRQFGQGSAPPVPGPFSSAPPPSKPRGGTPGLS